MGHQGKRRFTEREVEIALCWMRSQTTTTKVRQAIFGNAISHSSVYLFLARALQQAFEEEKIKNNL